jgi:class 3 adenylate cyclase/WD40 repeat protein
VSQLGDFPAAELRPTLRSAHPGLRSEREFVEILPSTREDSPLGVLVRAFLIADIRGYSTFTRERGDETAARLAARFADLARDSVEARGGRVIELRGDEALAVFDQTAQAVRAALEFQQACQEATAEDPELPLPVGVGIDWGEAIPVEDGYRGAALNMAARLCSKASAGQVLVTGGVARDAAGLEDLTFQSVGTAELKGFDRPVELLQARSTREGTVILELPAVPGRLPPELDDTIPLVDREHELRWLRGTWRQARRGYGRVLLLSGPAGIGKTRLAAELAGHVKLGGGAIRSAGLGGAGGAEALAAIGGARSVTDPALYVVDQLDLHPEAITALAESVKAIESRPVLLVGMFRDAEGQAGLIELVDRVDGRGDGHRWLGPLDLDGVKDIARSYLGDLDAFPEFPAESMLRSSGGVPARMHEVVSEWVRDEAKRRMAAAAEWLAAGRGKQANGLELAHTAIALKLGRMHVVPSDELLADRCPYKGLAAFEGSDAAYFYGRERLVGELAARTVGMGLLGVAGPSGSGKSSMVMAGLLPSLAAGLLPGSERWRQALLRPGERPVEALERTLASGHPGERLVLAVDQFEELFTTTADDAERVEFVNRLVELARDPEEAVVVATIRADYTGQLASYPELAELFARNLVLVGPMGPQELRRAIELPARRVGLHVESPLVEALVEEVEKEPGGLPLLSTALVELWLVREDGWLRMETYERTGGVRGAVGRLAEASFARLEGEEQEAARSILLRLVGQGEGEAAVRRRVPLSEFDQVPAVQAVLARFTQDRLLTASEGTVEVAHEALIREWPRLRAWLEEDVQGRQIRAHVTQAAKQWQDRDRDHADLYRGTRLSVTLDWAVRHGRELNELEREFVEESKAAAGREAERLRRTNRRLRGLLVGVAVFLVVALVAGSLALVQRSTANRQRNLARSQSTIAKARGLAAQATSLVRTRLDLSLLLAVEGLRTDDSLQSRAGLLTALNGARYLVGFRDELGKDLAITAVSGDGTSVATATKQGLITVWNIEKSEATAQVGPVDGIVGLSLSKDGSRVAAGGKNGVHIWDTGTGEPVGKVLSPSGPHNLGSYVGTLSADGSMLLVQDWSAEHLTVTLWQLDRPAKIGKFELPDTAGFLGSGMFAPDDRSVVLIGGNSVASFDTATGKQLIPVKSLGDRPAEFGGASSPAADLIAVSSSNNPVRISLLNSGSFDPVGPPLTLATGGRLYALSFSPNGRRLAAETDDGAVTIFSVPDGTITTTLSGRLGLGTGMGWLTPDRLISSTSAGVIEWDLTRSSALGNLVEEKQGFTSYVAFLADGKLVFSNRDSLTIRSGDGEQTIELNPACGRISTSHSGALVAASCDPGLELVDVNARRLLKTYPVDGYLWNAVFSPDDQYLALVASGSLSVLKVANGETVMPPMKLDDFILLALAWSADGRTLMTGGQQGDVIFVDTKTWRPVDRLTLEPQGIALPDFQVHPDRRRMFVASESGFVWVVDIQRRTIDGAPLAASGTQLEGVALSPDAKYLAAISRDGALRLWETDTRRAFGPALSGHAFEATGVAWGKAGLYSAGTTHIDFAKDEGQVGLLEWNGDPRRLSDLACGFVRRNLTRAEWSEFVGDADYRVTCRAFPPGA